MLIVLSTRLTCLYLLQSIQGMTSSVEPRVLVGALLLAGAQEVSLRPFEGEQSQNNQMW